MASSSLQQRIRAFLRSPGGRRVVDQGRRELAKPSTQQKLKGILARLSRRR